MDFNSNAVQERIFRDMLEGIIVIGMNGRIEQINPKACEILSFSEKETFGKLCAELFFKYKENDAFTQTILDAIYESHTLHVAVVPYFNGRTVKHLHVMTSFLKVDNQRIGVIAVLSDITEMVKLREKVEEKNAQITALLDSMVSAFSGAIDERSHYTANHTKNMVRLAEAFLDWLDDTDNPWKFDAEKRHAFLMSIWLHDVGKLAIPLQIMDKADRLGTRLENVHERLRIIGLLNRIAEAEGRVSPAEADARRQELQQTRAWIDRINKMGFLPDEELCTIEELSKRRFEDEEGNLRPWITDEERLCLSIRRGTLTDKEREIIQSHVVVTRRILNCISFPDSYRNVPVWAGAHHEQMNGRGYPEHLTSDNIPMEVRLLTILDIFEALTAKDRPYKKPFLPEKAFLILGDMAWEGAVDAGILELFKRSGAWKDNP